MKLGCARFVGAVLLLTIAAQARAGAVPTGGAGTGPQQPMASNPAGGFSGQMGFNGQVGLSGQLGFSGQPGNNMIGMGGCFGMCPLQPCGFSGCVGMCGLGGCFGSFHCSMGGCMGFIQQPQPTQTYSKWSSSPGGTYYYRVLHVQTPAPKEGTLEFIMVHQPDRSKFFYFFDTVDKKYFGRLIIGGKAEQNFNLVPFADRRANIKDIPESAFRAIAGMPTIPQIIRPRPGTTIEPTLQQIKLARPPEGIPDDLLGLPPEEIGLKKTAEKKWESPQRTQRSQRKTLSNRAL